MTDVLIIGSGPAGLTAGIYAKRAGLSVLIAEKEYLGTGQIAQTAAVDNYPGMPGVSGYDLGEAFRNHAASLGVEFFDGSAQYLKRLGADPESEKYRGRVNGGLLRTDAGAYWECLFDTDEKVTAKTVIYAVGCTYRTLHIPGELALLGKKIHFCATCDGTFYEGKTVAVIGGSQMAATDALYLSGVAQKVLIIYRGRVLRAARAEVDRINACDNIEVIYDAVPWAFEETSDGVAIRIADGRTITADGVFEAVGMVPQTANLQGVVSMDTGGFIIADETGETSAPGFFAAGDVRTKPLRQVITACADGANAALSAERFIKTGVFTSRQMEMAVYI